MYCTKGIVALLLFLGIVAPSRMFAQVKRPFTVADDIALTHFLEIGSRQGAVSFSPDHRFFVVWSERGRLDVNRVENSLRFYRTQEVAAFLDSPGKSVSPIWVITRLGEIGGVIDQWRWLPDSKELVFLQRVDDRHSQLALADIIAKSTTSLTPPTERVDAFNVRDRLHYAYRTLVSAPPKEMHEKKAAIIGTGHTLQELLFPEKQSSLSRTRFWKVAGGHRLETKESDAAFSTDEGFRVKANDIGNGLEVFVKQCLDEPPVLVARNKQSSRVLWDPNPQLKDFDLGQASVYTWKDKDERERRAGLYKPNAYTPGHKYPLVIQTHDFLESQFSSTGSKLTSSYAAREMAAVGIVVLQVGENCPSATTEDGPCAVSAYESAVRQLVSDGIADPERVGIVAFSWPSFYVMDFLTTGNVPVKAALISSGQFMGDYFQYIASVDGPNKQFLDTTNAVIGAAPFGDGLQQWLKNSPTFHLDRITTPLMMVGQDRLDVLSMWAPYAGLQYLRRPVDLILLNAKGHVLTNPRARMLSQGATVDWFRFWLQGYEDPDPFKAPQYKRWNELRKMQAESENNGRMATQ